ncbi:MAG TPA: DNA repair protein RadC [Vicinamibacterales bacterium]|nr:DNA repair protein RadC [Vicinamibacterales bacterium]
MPTVHPSPSDRPREKLERAGAHALGDNELLALVLGHGTAQLCALAVADRLLASAGGVHGLARLRPSQLAKHPGVGAAQASRIRAAIELGRRTLTTQPAPRPRLQTSRDLARHLLPEYGTFPLERFGVVLLDTKYRLLKTSLLSVGSLDASVVHPREVFQEAVTIGAAAVAVFHNHPSGDPTPSHDDRVLTYRLQQAGLLLGIPLVDHLILADTRYYSLREDTG